MSNNTLTLPYSGSSSKELRVNPYRLKWSDQLLKEMKLKTSKPRENAVANSATVSKLDPSKGVGNVRAVERALDILKAFNAKNYSMSASELMKKVNLSRPTLYRLLKTLENNDFISSSSEPLKFRLGPAVAQMAHAWTSAIDLTELAQPVLENLWSITGETVVLFQLQGLNRVCIAELASQHALNYKIGVGYKELISVGASGRAILAFTDLIQEFETSPIPNIKNKKINLKKELEDIRQKGYALSQEEVIEGAVAIAAPFFKNTGEVVGSIAVFGPSVRMKGAEIIKHVKHLLQASNALSISLGANV